MQHVSKRFRMHETMFQCHMEQEAVVPGVIERLSDPVVVTTNVGYGRPVRWSIRRQPAIDRIDPESEQPVELRIESLHIAHVWPQQIPIESLQVSEIKDDAVPLRNRPFIKP